MQAMRDDKIFLDFICKYDCALYNSLLESSSDCLFHIVPLLIDAGFDINGEPFQDEEVGVGPLHRVLSWSMDQDFRLLFQHMLMKGTNLAGPSLDKSIFVQAAKQGSLWAVIDLVQTEGYQPPERWSWVTMGAVHGGQLEMVKHLHESKIFGVGDKSKDNFTALNGAAVWGQESIVKYILEFVKDKTHLENRWEDTSPIFDACSRGHVGIVKILLKHGASATRPLGGDGATPFFIACYNGRAEVVEHVLQLLRPARRYINKHSPLDKHGLAPMTTPLHIACSCNHPQTVRLLIEYGADLDRGKSKADGHENGLHAAACDGYAEVVKLLLDHGADYIIRTSPSFVIIRGLWTRGDTAMDLAKKNGHKEIVRMLTDAEAKRQLWNSKKIAYSGIKRRLPRVDQRLPRASEKGGNDPESMAAMTEKDDHPKSTKAAKGSGEETLQGKRGGGGSSSSSQGEMVERETRFWREKGGSL